MLPSEADVVLHTRLHVPLLLVRQRALHPGRRAEREHPGRNLRAGGDEAPGADHRPLPDLDPVQDDAADADERVVADAASVQDYAVADGHPVAHHDREPARVHVDDGVVLDVRLPADADALDVPAQHRAVPDAAAGADRHVADHDGAGSYERGFVHLRRPSPDRPDHAFSLFPAAAAGAAPDSPPGAAATFRMRSASPLLTRSSASASAFASCESMSRLRRRPAPATSTLELSAERIRTTWV